MLSELHLKFHSETGTTQVSQQFKDWTGRFVDVATEQYLEWLEELAARQLKREEPLYAEIRKLREQVKCASELLEKHNLL